jgi:hypothetical protein
MPKGVKVYPPILLVQFVDPCGDQVAVKNPQEPRRHVKDKIIRTSSCDPSPKVCGEVSPKRDR